MTGEPTPVSNEELALLLKQISNKAAPSNALQNALLTVAGGIVMTVCGYFYTIVTGLQQNMVETQATRFTEEEANQLRNDITLTLQEIDKRLTIQEHDNKWLEKWVLSTHAPGSHDGVRGQGLFRPDDIIDGSNNITGFDEALPDAPPAPKYDLRAPKQQVLPNAPPPQRRK